MIFYIPLNIADLARSAESSATLKDAFSVYLLRQAHTREDSTCGMRYVADNVHIALLSDVITIETRTSTVYSIYSRYIELV